MLKCEGVGEDRSSKRGCEWCFRCKECTRSAVHLMTILGAIFGELGLERLTDVLIIILGELISPFLC